MCVFLCVCGAIRCSGSIAGRRFRPSAGGEGASAVPELKQLLPPTSAFLTQLRTLTAVLPQALASPFAIVD